MKDGLIYFFKMFMVEGKSFTLYRANYLRRYEGNVLGKLWVLIMPCLPIFIYNLLQYLKVFNSAVNEVPRSLFLSLGILVYYAFSDGLTTFSSLHVSHRKEILDTGFSKRSLVQYSFFQVVSDSMIRFGCVLLMFLVSGYPVPAMVLTVPFVALFGILFGGGIGLVVSLMMPIYRDLQNVVQIAAFYLLFASGVFRTIPGDNWFFIVLKWSPVYNLVNGSRDLVFGLSSSVGSGLYLSIIVCVVVFFLSVIVFGRAEKTVNSYL